MNKQTTVRNQMRTLENNARKELLNFRIIELRAQAKVNELCNAAVIDPKALGRAYGRLVEIRCQCHKVIVNLYTMKDPLFKDMGGPPKTRQMTPSEQMIPTPVLHVESGCWTVSYIGGTYIDQIWSSLIDNTFVIWFTDGTSAIGHYADAA